MLKSISHLPKLPTSHDTIAESLATWEQRLALWNLNAGCVSDSDMRALYVCGVSCAEKIVRQLRNDLASSASSCRAK